MELDLSRIPADGTMLAYFQSRFVFSGYRKTADGILPDSGRLPEQETASECHFFNKEQEYRCYFSSFSGHFTEESLTRAEEEAMPPELLREEWIWLKPGYWKSKQRLTRLRIVYRLEKLPDGSLRRVNYRLAGIEEHF